MKSITLSVCISLVGLMPVSGSSATSQVGTEERELQNTPLQLGPDCEPKNLTDKLRLRTLSAAQTKYFWLGQRYAVERSYNNEIKRQQLEAINKDADSQIAEIEAQRTDANLAALGIRQVPLPPSVIQSIQKSTMNSDALLSRLENQRKQGSYNYFVKCRRYADDRSK